MKFLQGPRGDLRIHRTLLALWSLLLIPSIMWWKDLVVWVTVMSHYTILVGHWVGVGEAKVAVEQEKDSGTAAPEDDQQASDDDHDGGDGVERVVGNAEGEQTGEKFHAQDS